MSIILDTSHLDKNINILEVFSEAHKHDFREYTVANPHPGYGVDPNIKDEFGHTEYPKMVYPNGKDSPGVVVNNAEEEAQVTGKEVKKPEAPKIEGW